MVGRIMLEFRLAAPFSRNYNITVRKGSWITYWPLCAYLLASSANLRSCTRHSEHRINVLVHINAEMLFLRDPLASHFRASVETTNGGTFSTESNGFPFMLGPRQCGATC